MDIPTSSGSHYFKVLNEEHWEVYQTVLEKLTEWLLITWIQLVAQRKLVCSLHLVAEAQFKHLKTSKLLT